MPPAPRRTLLQPPHATIYRAVQAAHANRGLQAEARAVNEALLQADAGRALLVSQPAITFEIMQLAPMVGSIDYWASQIIEAWRDRRGEEALNRAQQIRETSGIDAARERLEEDLAEIAPATRPATVNTWQPVDLTGILNGDSPPLQPTILTRADGHALLYPGKVHSVSGESESGKTWLLLAAVAEQLGCGYHVLYLDFEDAAEAITARLTALGVPPNVIAGQLHYSRPDTPIDGPARQALAPALALRPTLAVIDGVTEAMTVHGLDPLGNSDAATFYALLPRWLAHQGPAVALIDHVPKDEDRNKRYALGAQHKLAGLDGAAYMVDLIRPFGHGQHGISRVRIAKDRPGRVREQAPHQHACDLHLESHNGTVTLTLRPPVPYDDAPGGGFRPTHLMEKVSRYVETHPGLSSRAIRTAVKGRDEHLILALELLVSEGYIDTEKGPRNASHHQSARPFRETPDPDDEAGDEDAA